MKHAYLIIAHNEFDILEKQLRLLDDPRNDFYIHIDKKVKAFPFERFRSIPKYSQIHFVKRLDIRWGSFAMIRCELMLLEAAVKGDYRYYHLLSGVDLPLKSNDEIHGFFAQNDGKELVQFWPMVDRYLPNRTERFHLIRLKTSTSAMVRAFGKLVYLPIRALHRLGYRRKWDLNRTFAYGGNWFSITHDLAVYVLAQKRWIRKRFFMTECADELFLQCIVADSPFRERLLSAVRTRDHKANMRCIDWDRCEVGGKNPRTFRVEDREMLMHTPCLFARKFSTKVDAQIIEDIFRYVSEKNQDQ